MEQSRIILKLERQKVSWAKKFTLIYISANGLKWYLMSVKHLTYPTYWREFFLKLVYACCYRACDLAYLLFLCYTVGLQVWSFICGNDELAWETFHDEEHQDVYLNFGNTFKYIHFQKKIFTNEFKINLLCDFFIFFSIREKIKYSRIYKKFYFQ